MLNEEIESGIFYCLYWLRCLSNSCCIGKHSISAVFQSATVPSKPPSIKGIDFLTVLPRIIRPIGTPVRVPAKQYLQCDVKQVDNSD